MYTTHLRCEVSASLKRATLRFSSVKAVANRPENTPMTAAGMTASTWLEKDMPTCRGGKEEGRGGSERSGDDSKHMTGLEDMLTCTQGRRGVSAAGLPPSTHLPLLSPLICRPVVDMPPLSPWFRTSNATSWSNQPKWPPPIRALSADLLILRVRVAHMQAKKTCGGRGWRCLCV